MNSEKGQSLLEVIIAMTVGILVVTALVFATIFSLRNAAFAKNSAQATKLAQEGIERVKLGRDRNGSISALILGVDSWNGTYPIWSYRISGTGLCDTPAVGGATAGKCYFTVDLGGVLSNIGFASTSFPTSSYEGIPSSANPLFKRVILFSDDSNYATQKTVTVIVRWTDFAGDHQSQLTTILRKL